MNNKFLSFLVLALTVISYPVWVQGQNLGSKSGNPGQNAGQSKLGAEKQARPNNMPGKNVNSNRGSGNNSNINQSRRHHSGKAMDNGRNGNGTRHGKHHHDKGHHKFNPLYSPLYYSGYYGYLPYTGYYAYVDPDYPLGYGTTMGTSLERPSNLEVNRFNEDAPAPADYRRDNSGAGYTYTEPPEDIVVEYSGPPPSEEQTIYVWVDESGVPNYANDIDLVPQRYRDIVTILGAE